MFALSCFAGAMESKLSWKDQWISYRIGAYTGMAFQLMDDLLECTQSETEWEKTAYQDLKNGIYTAPLIFSMKQSPDFFKRQLSKETYTINDLLAIKNEMIRTNGIEKAEQLAQRYTNKALRLITQLPEGHSKEEIEQLTRALLYRKT